ncbi:TetR/AcrR family transcriptional regulator [Rossellomorea aquimaris]|nr:TetR/AcrR family transcriptional regulator [Rossellomorea aquimaris]WRP07309.1 TetR/AcrR family transcriptional regulator [Rossellomorea aquimaris]
MDGFQKRTDQKKEMIKNTAIELLRTLPPKKVSIRDISAKADVSMVTIYNYFQNKDGLFLEIVKDMVDEQLNSSRKIIESGEQFPLKIKKLIYNKSLLLSDFHPDFITYIMQNEETKRILSEVHEKESSSLIEKFIQSGIEEGYVNPELPAPLLMNMIELFRRDIHSQESILSSGFNMNEIHMHIIEMLLYGVSGKRKE